MLVDLRSDTVTRPTPGMLEAMRSAETGDDVFGEDPSVNKLEGRMSTLFGMEAALYCPSGTMSNQIAIKAHTQPGDEVICDESSHIYQYEGGGIAFNSGCQVKLLYGDRGRITADMVETAINPDDVHKPVSKLVSLENTANRGGGSCYDFREIERISVLARERGMGLHLDGARLFNALVAKKEDASNYGKVFDSISVCLNKGLGCPMGSVLMGSRDFIRQARRIRNVFGGGMRQAGFMAACGLYALDHHIDRLQEDHDHARAVSSALEEKGFVQAILPVETNILIFEVASPADRVRLMQQLNEKGIRCINMSPTRIRFVFHLQVSPAMVDYCINTIRSL